MRTQQKKRVHQISKSHRADGSRLHDQYGSPANKNNQNAVDVENGSDAKRLAGSISNDRLVLTSANDNTSVSSAVAVELHGQFPQVSRLGHDFRHVQIFGPMVRGAGEVGEAPAEAPPPAPVAEVKKPPVGIEFEEPKHETYTVTATTLAEAVAAIKARGKPGHDEAGLTDANPSASWDIGPGGMIINLIVRTPATITMPSWPGAASLSPAAKAEWDRYYAALEAHENGHLEIARSESAKLAQFLVGKTDAEGTVAVNEAHVKLVEAFKVYDEVTDHGRKTGGVIDTSIQ